MINFLETHLRARWLLLPAIGVAILVTLALTTSTRVPETYPWGDTATTSIYAMRAARGDLATGAYSRFHWNHPGPLLYQVLAPLYRLSGYHEISLKWTVLGVNLATLAALLLVIGRRAPFLAITVAAALVPLLYREQRLLFWAWNPIVPLLPLALAVGLAAAVAAGEVMLLPAFVGVASFIVQSHVGFTPLVLAMAAIAAAGMWRTRAIAIPEARPLFRGPFLWSVVVAAALWWVPVVHEIRTWPGNLMALGGFFLRGESPPHPWRDVLMIVANQLVGPFDSRWELTTFGASAQRSWPVILAVSLEWTLLAALTVRLYRRGAIFEASFAAICLALQITGIIATRAIAGPIADYLIVWLAVLGALGVASIAAAPGAGSLKRGYRFLRLGGLALAAYVGLWGFVGGTRLVGKQTADARSVVVRDLAADLRRYCEAERIARPILGFSWPAWQLATGIVLQFYKDDRPIALTDDYAYLGGDPFLRTGREDAEFYLMPQEDSALPPGVTRYIWLQTIGGERLVRVFRDPH